MRFQTEYLDLIDYNYYTVRCCATYEYVFVYFVYLPAAVWCVATLLVLQLQLLAAVRHRVPDGKICSRGPLHLIPVSLHSNTIFFNVPLGRTVAFSASIFFPIMHTYHSSFGLTGMSGAKAGVSPPRRSPPCTTYY